MLIIRFGEEYGSFSHQHRRRCATVWIPHWRTSKNCIQHEWQETFSWGQCQLGESLSYFPCCGPAVSTMERIEVPIGIFLVISKSTISFKWYENFGNIFPGFMWIFQTYWKNIKIICEFWMCIWRTSAKIRSEIC